MIHRKSNFDIPNDLATPDEMNEYFLTSIPLISADLDNLQYFKDNCFKYGNDTFSVPLLTYEKCQYYINSLRSNSSGVDSINASMLKYLPLNSMEALTNIINTSLATANFPKLWKRSLITPIAKVKHIDNCSQLRPINLIPTMSKIIEMWVFENLVSFVESNDILPSIQSGFRKLHSTETALIKVTDDIAKEVDSGKVVLLVNLDYSKAFELVNHQLLLAKLKYYGLAETACEWFKDYLSDRTQRVKFSNILSKELTVGQGVPQGTILGPLLFSMYTSDIAKCVALPCKIHMYADDTELYIASNPSEINSSIEILNEILKGIAEWTSINGLKLNPKKTEAICIGSTKSLEKSKSCLNSSILVEQLPIELSDHVKSLGIYLDCNLNFQHHVDTKCRMAYGKLRTLYQHRQLLPSRVKLMLANSLVLSQINYGAIVYYNFLSSTYKAKLQILQNSCLRYAYYIPYREHITRYYNLHGILKLENRYLLQMLIFIFKLLKNKCPMYLYSFFKFIECEMHFRRQLMFVPKCNSNKYQHSFAFTAARLFNEYYEHFVSNVTIASFRNSINDVLLREQTV